MKFDKVWGETSEVFSDDGVHVHAIKVHKGGYCSRHIHAARWNLFYVFSGKLRVYIRRNNGLIEGAMLGPGERTTVPPGDVHWFEALEDTTALEVYYREPISDRDIVRETRGGIENIAEQ